MRSVKVLERSTCAFEAHIKREQAVARGVVCYAFEPQIKWEQAVTQRSSEKYLEIDCCNILKCQYI